MEASGVVYRPLPRVCGGAGVGGTNRVGNLRFPVVRKYAQSGFSDEGYLKYYYNSNSLPEGRIRCGGGGGGGAKLVEEVKGEEKKKMKLMKKRLKLLKSLDFAGFDLGSNNNRQGLLDQVKGNMISDATEVLLTQLGQQLRAEQKELKRKKKEAKALKKAEQKKNKKMMMLQCDMASSSSSESSSDSECGEVVDMSRRLKTQVLAPPPPPPVGNELQQEQLLESTAAAASITTTTAGHGGGLVEELQHSRVNVAIVDQPLSSSSEIVENRKKIEVCMGGKCKKSGAALLIEEFNKVLGSSSSSVAAVGCKCMGKCRSAPNVRVLNEEAQNTSVAAKSLCIGVGIDDVGTIVSNFLLQTPPIEDGFSASWSGAM